MNQKIGEKSECLDDQSASPAATKNVTIRSKRQMGDSPQQNKPYRPAPKRIRINDEFTNPWRCDSAPYESLPITYHKPIFNPPCYFDENLNQLTKSELALKIMSYHYALSMQMSICARAQPQQALLGDPLQGSQLFNGALERKKPIITTSDILYDKEDTYVSRSGRLVKRRQNLGNIEMMAEEDDTEKDKSYKKAKIQSGKDEPIKTTPAAKKTTKKITNEEIMSRSSLFADSAVGTKSRTQLMFNMMDQTEKETKKAEAEKRKFEQTLEHASDDDLEITSSQSPKADDDSSDFVRRRIVPPLPQKKGKNLKFSDFPSTSASSAGNRDDFNSSPSSLSSSQGLKSLNGGSAGASSANSGNKRGPKKKITNCPICGESFPTNKIEEHASTCGLTSELEIKSSIPNQRADTARY